ncbi:MAG: hypothetical protein ABSG15_00775 [FCB group bacterium]|jgi:hypothetical protein
MNKYTFVSYVIFADSEDEAWEQIQESINDNELSVCLSCVEEEITFDDYKNLNPLGLDKEALNNLTEENLKDYIEASLNANNI